MTEATRFVVDGPRIHETAVVHPGARLGEGTVVGPYCIIGDEVTLGPRCELMSHVRIDGPLVAGAENCFHHGAAIGGVPQDLKYSGARSFVRLGDGNVFREFVTVNRATDEGGATVLGNRNLLMAYVHVAHDCILQNDVILANSVQLAGHIVIESYATVGGMTAIHQFVRIGTYAFVGGGSRVTKDIPPFFKAAGSPMRVLGPNSIGLTRRGFDESARRDLKEAFRLLYRSELNVSQAVRRIRELFPDEPNVKRLVEFVESSERGIVQ